MVVEETKLLIALWSEEAVQHELNTMHNKKLLWDKISQGMADVNIMKLFDRAPFCFQLQIASDLNFRRCEQNHN